MLLNRFFAFVFLRLIFFLTGFVCLILIAKLTLDFPVIFMTESKHSLETPRETVWVLVWVFLGFSFEEFILEHAVWSTRTAGNLEQEPGASCKRWYQPWDPTGTFSATERTVKNRIEQFCLSISSFFSLRLLFRVDGNGQWQCHPQQRTCL